MITNAMLLSDAEALIVDAHNAHKRILASAPDREPLARAILDDTVRVWTLIRTRLPSGERNEAVAALLVRARLMSEALNAPLQ